MITGSAEEKPYDVSSYKQPSNPTLDDMGGVKLASNKEEELLLELLPTVANGFLKRRRAEENEKVMAVAAAKAAEEALAQASAGTQPAYCRFYGYGRHNSKLLCRSCQLY